MTTATPMLDKIAAEQCLDDSTQLTSALCEINHHHNTALHAGLGLRAEIRCNEAGWAIHFDDGTRSGECLTDRHGRRFVTAEDAIHALREKVDGWIVQAEGEDAEPCTEAARKAGCTCTVPLAHSASIDPPEPRIDRDCSLHGWNSDTMRRMRINAPTREHDWRAPVAGEAQEEGGFCRNCGVPATSGQHQPCRS